MSQQQHELKSADTSSALSTVRGAADTTGSNQEGVASEGRPDPAMQKAEEQETRGNEEQRSKKEYEECEREFRAFMSDCKDMLDETTTVKLLAGWVAM